MHAIWTPIECQFCTRDGRRYILKTAAYTRRAEAIGYHELTYVAMCQYCAMTLLKYGNNALDIVEHPIIKSFTIRLVSTQLYDSSEARGGDLNIYRSKDFARNKIKPELRQQMVLRQWAREEVAKLHCCERSLFSRLPIELVNYIIKFVFSLP